MALVVQCLEVGGLAARRGVRNHRVRPKEELRSQSRQERETSEKQLPQLLAEVCEVCEVDSK